MCPLLSIALHNWHRKKSKFESNVATNVLHFHVSSYFDRLQKLAKHLRGPGGHFVVRENADTLEDDKA